MVVTTEHTPLNREVNDIETHILCQAAEHQINLLRDGNSVAAEHVFYLGGISRTDIFVQ